MSDQQLAASQTYPEVEKEHLSTRPFKALGTYYYGFNVKNDPRREPTPSDGVRDRPEGHHQVTWRRSGQLACQGRSRRIGIAGGPR